MAFAIHGSISFYISNLLKINGENNSVTNRSRCRCIRIPAACLSLNQSHVARVCGDLAVPRWASGKGRGCGRRTSEAREGRREGRFCAIAKGKKGRTRELAAKPSLEARMAAAAPVASFLYIVSQQLWPEAPHREGRQAPGARAWGAEI